MAVKIYQRLGEILLKEGIVNETQLQEAVALQKTAGKRLGEVLIDLHYVTDIQLAQILGKQLGLPFRSFANGALKPGEDPALKTILSENLIRKQLVLPLARSQNSLTVALTDPLDLILIDNLKKITGLQINPVIATKLDLLQAIETIYGKRDFLKEAVVGSYEETRGPRRAGESSVDVQIQEGGEPDEPLDEQDLAAKAGETQVVRIVDLILMEAINARASDIHIEPYAHKVSIRFRIDGLLQPIDPPSPQLTLAIISRVKILAKMDIAEKRLPQDGSFTIKVGEKTVDLRVSTIPIIFGEKVVLRLLDKSNLAFDFNQLGMDEQEIKNVERAIKASYGLIFITGPTGSGKSTTLYATLSRLKTPTRNILTIEDPVEYKLEGINQVQAKPQIGLTFAAGLRAFLRQDPDIIMVGEVRDLETAEICVRAALTGHLVLSTLHTNDAPSAITRLTDLGIEPFLLSPSLLLVIAQRLIRKLCPKCRERFDPLPTLRKKVHLPPGEYYRSKGCPNCRNMGFRGRLGLYEVMTVGEKMREIIAAKGSLDELRKAAHADGMRTLLESGIAKAAAGLTTLEEVFSVTSGAAEE